MPFGSGPDFADFGFNWIGSNAFIRNQVVSVKLSIFLFVLLSFSTAGNAAEDILSGSTLLKNCKSYLKVSGGSSNSDIILGAGLCLGTVRGIIDAGAVFDTFADQAGNPRPNVFCVPESVSTDRGVRVVIQYLEEHPEDLHQRGTTLTVLALKQAFPCR